MNLRFLALVTATSLAASCDRAREWWGNAGGGDDARVEFPTPGGDVREDLDRRVRRSSDGLVFRRDLRFPSRLEGRIAVNRRLENVRVTETSALGREDRTISQRTISEIDFAKASGRFSFTTHRLGRPLETGDDDRESPSIKPKRREGRTLEFVLRSDRWEARRSSGDPDLATRIWADALSPEIPRLLVHCGAYPRTQWFSSSRNWQPGDRLTLTGRTVNLLNPFDASGRLELVFQGEEAVGGHPCGVFSVSGDMTVRGETDFEGRKADVDISISEGKIWASLLYPILLREEYRSVRTTTIGNRDSGATETHSQGRVDLTISRVWQADSE